MTAPHPGRVGTPLVRQSRVRRQARAPAVQVVPGEVSGVSGSSSQAENAAPTAPPNRSASTGPGPWARAASARCSAMCVSSVQRKWPRSTRTGRVRTDGPLTNSSGRPKASPRARPRKAARPRSTSVGDGVSRVGVTIGSSRLGPRSGPSPWGRRGQVLPDGRLTRPRRSARPSHDGAPPGSGRRPRGRRAPPYPPGGPRWPGARGPRTPGAGGGWPAGPGRARRRRT